MGENKLETAQAWLHNWDLLIVTGNKELTLEWAVKGFWALSKHQFGKTMGKAELRPFLHRLVPCEAMLLVV